MVHADTRHFLSGLNGGPYGPLGFRHSVHLAQTHTTRTSSGCADDSEAGLPGHRAYALGFVKSFGAVKSQDQTSHLRGANI